LSGDTVVVVGLIIGFIGAVMGIGGGFILIPIMIYLLAGATSTVIGYLDGADAGHHGVRHHAARGHQPSRRCGAGADSDGRGVTGAQFGARAGQKIAANICGCCWGC